MYSCPSRPLVPRDTRTEVGYTSVPQILLCTPVHPVHLYHGTQGQKWDILVYHRYHCVLLSIPSTCTIGHKDRSGMYWCTTDTVVYSCPLVPRDTRTEVGYTSVPQILLCTPVHPVHLYHRTQGQKWDLLVYHIYCCVFLSTPPIRTMGKKDRSGMY